MLRMKLSVVLFLFVVSSPLFAQKKILYFGDSQSYGSFGTFLSEELEKGDSACDEVSEKKNEVRHFAIVGSSPRHWSDPKFVGGQGKWLCGRKMKKYQTGIKTTFGVDKEFCPEARRNGVSVVEEIINQYNPDKVVFQFLGNSGWFYDRAQKLGKKKGAAYLKKYVGGWIKRLLTPVIGRECLFITSNPSHKSKASLNKKRRKFALLFKEYIKDAYPACEFILGNSEETISTLASSTANYQSDRSHMSARGGRIFANYVAKKMCLLGQ